MFDGFVSELGAARLHELPRYLEAVLVRLDSLPAGAVRDRSAMAVLDRVYAAYDRLLTSLPEAQARATGRRRDHLAYRGAPGQPFRTTTRHTDAGVGEANRARDCRGRARVVHYLGVHYLGGQRWRLLLRDRRAVRAHVLDFALEVCRRGKGAIDRGES